MSDLHCASCRLFVPPDQLAQSLWRDFVARHPDVTAEAPGFCPRTFARESGGIWPTRASDPACEAYQSAAVVAPIRAPVPRVNRQQEIEL
jgi:hypothetical protein